MEKIDEYSKIMNFQTFLYDNEEEVTNHLLAMKTIGYSRVSKGIRGDKIRVHYCNSQLIENAEQTSELKFPEN